MSIFGDLDTPASKKPEPPVKQLVELSIKPHVQLPVDERGKVLVPALQALLDPPTQSVTVWAEAKTAFADGTTGDGVAVAFFLNGKRLCDVRTDDFGIALLEHPIPANLFTMNWQVDELTARVRGFAKEASAKVQVLSKQIIFLVKHRWMRVDQRPDTEGRVSDSKVRYDDLELMMQVEHVYPPGFTYTLNGIVVLVERLRSEIGQYEILGSSTFDTAGKCTIRLPNYCYDRQLIYQRHLQDLSWSQSRNDFSGVRIRLKGWEGRPEYEARIDHYHWIHKPYYCPDRWRQI